MTACRTDHATQAHQPSEAAWRLTLENVGLAYKLAARFAVGRKGGLADLRQQAVIALHRAAVTFDAGRGLAFSTHAWTVVSRSLTTIARADAARRRSLPITGSAHLHLIAAPIHAHGTDLPDLSILDTREQYVIARLFGLSGDEPATLREIAADLGVCHKTVGRLRDRALARLRLDYGLPATEAA